MKLDFVANVLNKKLKTNSLGHFYLIKFNEKHLSFLEIAQQFNHAFLGQAYDHHPDVLFVDRDADENNYKVDSENIARFLQFINYAPVNFKHKFIYINQSHLISETLANKLLKTFEELNSSTTIFLGVPKQYSVLPTIKSRSIEIAITEEKIITADHLDLDNESLQKIITELKKDNLSESQLIDLIVNWHIAKNSDYKSLEALLNNIKTFNLTGTFHNSLVSRVASLLP